MIIPKMLLLFVPLLVMVDAQYNSLERSKFDRSIPLRRPLPRNTWMRPTSNAYLENRFPSRNTEVVGSPVNSVPESITKEPKLSIVYPESYTTAAPFQKPMWARPAKLDFDRQTTTYAPILQSNPSEESQYSKETINASQTSHAETPAQESATSIQPQEPIPIVQTNKPLESDNPILNDIHIQNGPSVITPSESYENPKTNSPHTLRVHSPAYKNIDNKQNLPYQPHDETVNAPTPVWNSPKKPSTTSSTTTWIPKPRFTTTTAHYNDIQLHNYDCRRANGYEAVPNECSFYVECNNNRAYQSECPEGLYFDATIRFPNFPCEKASQVNCQSQSVTQEQQQQQQLLQQKQQNQPQQQKQKQQQQKEQQKQQQKQKQQQQQQQKQQQQQQNISECPKPSGYFPFPIGDCGKFIQCQNGAATEMSCPPGLAYSSATNSCDWPVNVPGCNPKAFKGFSCPAPVLDESDEAIDLISNHRYKNSCKNYIACHKGYPRLLSCDTDYSFDASTNKCVNSDIVKNCEN